jgi:NAD(P)H dehydrogenase (quinone)
MIVLLVTAHPLSASLTAALASVARDALVRAGHTVLESHLYEMGWDAVLREEQFAGPVGGTESIGDRSASAYRSGTLPSDVVAEQEKLGRADLVIFHFPLWWYGMPAIMKGWFDRVFVKGYAFGVKDPSGRTRKYGDGGLAGKRALIVVNAGDRPTAFDSRGLNGEASELFFPITHGIFWYTGMQPLEPHLVAGADRLGWDGFEGEAARLRDRLAHLGDEPGIEYRTLDSGDYDGHRVLRPDIRPGEIGVRIHLQEHRGDAGSS